MKKTAGKLQTQDHVKPFIVAIGIAFTFLALVVIYVAFTKGGLDIRSRAGQLISERCYTASVKTYANGKPVYTCLSGGSLKNGQCCIRVMQKTEKVMATPTPKTCTPGTAGCIVKQGQLMQTKVSPTPTKAVIRVMQKVMATPTPKK